MQELTRIRNERGWSQQRLADESGVNKATINQIERGRRSPNVDTLAKLAAALRVEIGDFFPKAQAPLPEQGERRPAILADAVTTAAETWIAAVSNPDINIHKRFGMRDAAIELFDCINARLIGKLETLATETRNEIVVAMRKLNEVPEEAYRAMPDETLKEALEERRKKMREWTRRISA